MSKDPFDAIGKIDKTRQAGAAASVQGNVPLFRGPAVGGATGATPAGTNALSATDQVHLSHDVSQPEDSTRSQAVSGLVNAWGPSTNANAGAPGFTVSQGPEKGMQAGAVIGSQGTTGLQPGMHAGAVYTHQPLGT